jgi:hypothetical protein
MSLEQRDSEKILELTESASGCRLSEVQFVGSAYQGAMTGDRVDEEQMPEL